MDLSSMTEVELDVLRERVSEEQRSRTCREFLSGHQSCDKGASPHEEHGYTTWQSHGRNRVRVTWVELPEGS